MALLFLRLTPQKTHQSVAKGILIATSVWLVVSIFLIALRCDLSHPWIFINPKCTSIVSFDLLVVQRCTNCCTGWSLENRRCLRCCHRSSSVRDAHSPCPGSQNGVSAKDRYCSSIWSAVTVSPRPGKRRLLFAHDLTEWPLSRSFVSTRSMSKLRPTTSPSPLSTLSSGHSSKSTSVSARATLPA